MALPLIQASDVLARLGEDSFDGSEQAQVDSFIRYASGLLRSKLPTLDARIEANSVDHDLVVGAVVTAVVRALDSMRVGLRVRAEQHPEYQATYTDATEELVYFTAGEIGPLVPAVSNSAGAFSIRVGLQ